MFERLWKKSDPIRVQMLAGFSASEAQALVTCLRRLIDNLAVTKGRTGHKRAKPMVARTAPSGK